MLFYAMSYRLVIHYIKLFLFTSFVLFRLIIFFITKDRNVSSWLFKKMNLIYLNYSDLYFYNYAILFFDRIFNAVIGML